MASQFISVILPTFNNQTTLGLAISSILLQDNCDFELIVIDDCSTDFTPKVISRFAAIDKRIKTLRLSSNIGEGGARNVGISLARGEFIAAQDGDDISLPHRLDYQSNYLTQNSRVDWVSTWGYTINSNYEIINLLKMPVGYSAIRSQLLNGRMPIIGASMMVRRQKLLGCGGYRNVSTDDYDLARRFVQNNMIDVIPFPLYAFVPVLESKQIRRYRQVFSLMLSFLHDYGWHGIGVSFLSHLLWKGLQGYMPLFNTTTHFLTRFSKRKPGNLYSSQEYDDWFRRLQKFVLDVSSQ